MNARPMRAAGPAGHVHTAGNAVPPLGEDLEDLVEDPSGIHPGVDLIRAGFRLILLDRLTRDQTQTILAALAGSADETDVLGLVAAAVARLTNPDENPCLRELDDDAAADVRRIGAAVAVDLTTTVPRDLTSEAAARIDPYAEAYAEAAADEYAAWQADLADMHRAHEAADQAEFAAYMDEMDARDAGLDAEGPGD